MSKTVDSRIPGGNLYVEYEDGHIVVSNIEEVMHSNDSGGDVSSGIKIARNTLIYKNTNEGMRALERQIGGKKVFYDNEKDFRRADKKLKKWQREFYPQFKNW